MTQAARLDSIETGLYRRDPRGFKVKPDFAREAAVQHALDQAVQSDADGCRSLPV